MDTDNNVDRENGDQQRAESNGRIEDRPPARFSGSIWVDATIREVPISRWVILVVALLGLSLGVLEFWLAIRELLQAGGGQ